MRVFIFRTLGMLGLLLTSVLLFTSSAESQQKNLSPSAAAEIEKILKLEAYPLRSPESSQFVVGDRIQLEIADGGKLAEKSQDLMKVGVLPGSDPLMDQGWYIHPDYQVDPKQPRLEIVPLNGGARQLPSLALRLGDEVIARTEPWSVDIVGTNKSNVLNSESQEEDKILPPVDLEFPVLIVAIIALGILILVLAVIWYLVRWSQKRKLALQPVSAPPKPLPPEHLVALQKLSQLELQGWVEKKNFKRLYFGVSDILKEYLTRRYGIEAEELTSREIVEELQKASVQKATVSEVNQLYSSLDFVKFTDYPPPSGEAEQMIRVARDFVQKTKRLVQQLEEPRAV